MLAERAVLVVTVLALQALGSPMAHATPDNPTLGEQAYVSDIHRFGMGDRAGDADMIQMGWNICNRLTDRASVAAMTREVQSSAINISYAHALATVRYAIGDLCPDKYDLLS